MRLYVSARPCTQTILLTVQLRIRQDFSDLDTRDTEVCLSVQKGQCKCMLVRRKLAQTIHIRDDGCVSTVGDREDRLYTVLPDLSLPSNIFSLRYSYGTEQ